LLHGITECLRICAPSPGIIPGQIFFEIGHFPEKSESIDNASNHFVQIRPLVLAQKSGEFSNVVIACTHDPFPEPAVVEIRTIAVPQFENRQRANDVAIKNTDRYFRKIVKVFDLGALGGGPDFLRHHLLLEGETRNLNRGKFQKIEMVQSQLRHRMDR